MLSIILMFCLANGIDGKYSITVYGDVYKDTKFFTRTYPWIIDNIGGWIMVDYHLLGSGRYSVPQMCALEELSHNTFLQAQYLKCEAERNPSAYCLCESGIDPDRFKSCVNNEGFKAATAAEHYTKLNIDTTPIVELVPRSTVFEVSDSWYLKKICTIFEEPPLGCVKPFACNSTETYTDSKAIAHFDKECQYHNSNCEYPITTSADLETTAYYSYD